MNFKNFFLNESTEVLGPFFTIHLLLMHLKSPYLCEAGVKRPKGTWDQGGCVCVWELPLLRVELCI